MLRRTITLTALLVPLVFAAAGCAPIAVSSHMEPTADFTRYHTFAWAPADALPVGDPRLDNNPFFQDYLTGAIEKRLWAHGLTIAQNPANADVLVHYHASVTQRFEVLTQNVTSGAYAEPQVADYDESTLTIDLVDARTDRLVWRGWAQDNLRAFVNGQDAMRDRINKSVEKIFERWPL